MFWKLEFSYSYQNLSQTRYTALEKYRYFYSDTGHILGNFTRQEKKLFLVQVNIIWFVFTILWLICNTNGIPFDSQLITELHFSVRSPRSSCFMAENCPQKSFRNLIKSDWNQIVLTIFRLFWNQTNVRLVPYQSENG